MASFSFLLKHGDFYRNFRREFYSFGEEIFAILEGMRKFTYKQNGAAKKIKNFTMNFFHAFKFLKNQRRHFKGKNLG